MLLKYFYDSPLAQASYLVGCQRTGEAIVIDPSRDVSVYLSTARDNGMKIVSATETHIHADFVSGIRELGAATGATLYLSDEGTADWKYGFTSDGNCQLVRDGDVIRVGKVELKVMHTPGHTPESICFVLTDRGGGANQPMGIFTGDFIFVGSIGRPDLLETAAGIVGSAEAGARQLFASLSKFASLPEYLQVWPAHGAGSACGKGLGAIPSSTVGYEKLFNPALQYHNEQSFVDYILADQPETPRYFGIMKRVNKVGPTLVSELSDPEKMPASEIGRIASSSLVIDLGPSPAYASAHVPGTINIPLKSIVQWAGFFVDYQQPLYLIADDHSIKQALVRLRSIGIDNVNGWFDAGEIAAAGLRTGSFPEKPVEEMRSEIESSAVLLVDVRAETEWDEGHIPQAEHVFLGGLINSLDCIPRDKAVVTQCRSGARSAIAASILARAGYNVTNLKGGFLAWEKAGFPVTAKQSISCSNSSAN